MAKEGWIEESLYSQIRKIMPLPCVDLLVIHDNSLLLLKRTKAPAEGQWFTPGSRILKGETLKQAVDRTLKEETSLSARGIEQVGAMVHFWPEVQTVTVFHKVYVDECVVKLNEDHSDYKWVKSVSESMHPYLIEMINRSKLV